MGDPEKKVQPSDKPLVIFTKYSPYLVVDLEIFGDAEGNPLPVQPVMSLCRCGQSAQKPYCDGSHSKIGFVGEKGPQRTPDRVKNYAGRDITIHDNRGVCAHDTSCTTLLPGVFDIGKRPWINPDGASVREIIETVEKCPSGALSYTIGRRRYLNLEREAAITVAKNGPLHLTGGIRIKDDQRNKPESQEHCTLCRCGESENKPFCDGTHRDINFDDAK
jgi:CDGSH-type Zn-finger protein